MGGGRYRLLANRVRQFLGEFAEPARRLLVGPPAAPQTLFDLAVAGCFEAATLAVFEVEEHRACAVDVEFAVEIAVK